MIIEIGVTTNKCQQQIQFNFNLHRKREQIERKKLSKVLKQWTYQS